MNQSSQNQFLQNKMHIYIEFPVQISYIRSAHFILHITEKPNKRKKKEKIRTKSHLRIKIISHLSSNSTAKRAHKQKENENNKNKENIYV